MLCFRGGGDSKDRQFFGVPTTFPNEGRICMRILIILIWLMTLLVLIAGCGDGTDRTTSQEQPSVVPEAGPKAEQTEENTAEKESRLNEPVSTEQGESAPDSAHYLFGEEVKALAKVTGCSGMERTTAASGGFGPLAGCIEGGAQTAKLFVNGAPDSSEVENVKVMWNDWFKDTGYGLHPDRGEAEWLLESVVNRYFPARLDEVKEAFFSRRVLNEDHEEFRIAVTHDKGSAIEEHLLTVTFPGH